MLLNGVQGVAAGLVIAAGMYGLKAGIRRGCERLERKRNGTGTGNGTRTV